MNKYKNKIIIGAAAAAVLALAFWWGGNSAGLGGWSVKSNTEASPKAAAAAKETPEASLPPAQSAAPQAAPDAVFEPSENDSRAAGGGENIEEAFEEAAQTGREEYAAYKETDGETGGTRISEPETESYASDAEDDGELSCTLSVRCDTVLDNMALLSREKAELIPSDGVIFPETTVVFYEGESVFNVILREMKKNKIHFEFENTPVYKSAYIEGINNLYEYDCGELSGWMYKVNGAFPSCGPSRCLLSDGDRVELVYTCSLGADVGGFYASQTEE